LIFLKFSFFELPVYSGDKSPVRCIADKRFLQLCGEISPTSAQLFLCSLT
jgi:hypothetical protein